MASSAPTPDKRENTYKPGVMSLKGDWQKAATSFHVTG